MANNLGGTYSTGTVAVTNNSAIVPGTGVLWADVEEGDWLHAAGTTVPISSVNEDFNQITLMRPWPGSTNATAQYIILKMSWLRYDPALMQAKVRELLTRLSGVGIIYYVTGPAPDPDLGEEGQFAIKIEPGAWTFWIKQGGVWVVAGNPIGGDRYDLKMFDTDRPASGELVDKWDAPTTTTFRAGLIESKGHAEVSATATAVYSVRKNGVQFATLTFNPGNPIGVWACAVDTVFAANDIFTWIAPSPRDNTLAGVVGLLVGYRS